MDIETKEVVLKLAGYKVASKRVLGRAYRVMEYEVISDHALPLPVDVLSEATTRSAAINLAYNTFLTRQNEVS